MTSSHEEQAGHEGQAVHEERTGSREGTAPYDTIRGIEDLYLTGLAGLRRLEADRMEAGYVRKERLAEFIVLGRWHLGSYGDFSPCTFEDEDGKKLDDALPKDMPRVLPVEERFALGLDLMRTFYRRALPPVHVTCPVCKRGWSMEDAHDTVMNHVTEVVPLTPHLSDGRTTLAEAAALVACRGSAEYALSRERSVRNDARIDPASRLTSRKDHLELKGELKGDERGFFDVNPKTYVIQPGDEGLFNVFQWIHKACNREKLAKDSRASFKRMLGEAGFPELLLTPIALCSIPNEYCPCEVCPPWFRLHWPTGGSLTIGWRKRVISIEWTWRMRDGGDGLDGHVLFKDEDVTKGEGFVHAWGEAKATEYLKIIRAAMRETSPERRA